VHQLTWTAHPARERPRAAFATTVVILALAAVAWLTLGHPAWAALAIAVLFLSLNRFFLPSRFEISDEAITVRWAMGTQTMRWQDLRRFAHDERGGFLSKRSRPSRFDSFSGMHLLFGDVRDQVIEAVRAHLPRELAA